MADLAAHDHSSPRPAPGARSLTPTKRLLRRWPTALGVTVGALTIADPTITGSFVESISGLLAVMVLVYVGSAASGHRRSAWPILVLALPVVILPLVDGSTAVLVLVVVTAVAAGYGAVRSRGADRDEVVRQTLVASAVAPLCLGAVAIAPTTGALLLALALLAHAAWDVYHHSRDRVVSRSYAEFCAVIDAVLGVAILIVVTS